MTENEQPKADVVDFTFELGPREISFDIDEELYALDAIYGAAYVFIDRAYIFLSRPAERRVRVRLRTKEASSAEVLEALAGEFANELLNSQLRLRIGRATAGIREQYMARAFFGTSAPSTIQELLAELDAEEMAEDALEVPVPWKDEAASGEPPKAEEPSG
ncbi:MAG: His-Xaa-Ser system protein HxsD [Polyangiaceae bacterium]